MESEHQILYPKLSDLKREPILRNRLFLFALERKKNEQLSLEIVQVAQKEMRTVLKCLDINGLFEP